MSNNETAEEKEVREEKKDQAVNKYLQSVESVQTGKAGELVGKNMADRFKIAQAIARSGLVPAEYQDDTSKVMAAMEYAAELRIPPLMAMREITVIDGRPALFGSLPLSIVQRSGKLEYIEEFLIDKSGKEIKRENANLASDVYGAVCIVKRVDDEKPLEVVFTWADAEKAGLVQKTNWKKYPKLMMKYRARSSALKDKFADCLSGMAIGEYDMDMVRADVPAGEPAQETPPEIVEKIERVNDLFRQLEVPRASQLVLLNKHGAKGRPENLPAEKLDEIIGELEGRIAGILDADQITKGTK